MSISTTAPTDDRKSKPLLAGLLFLATFFGYDAILFMIFGSGSAGISQSVTIPFRIIAALIAAGWIYVMLRQRRAILRPLLFWIIVIFWLLYLARIVHDTLFVEAPLAYGQGEYFLRYFGMLVIPSFAFIFKLTGREARVASRFTVLGACGALLIGFFLYRQFLGQDYRALARAGVGSEELISPLTFSYLGAACVVIGTYYVFTVPRLRIQHTLLVLGAWVLGVAGIFYGASRGAILAVVVSLLPLSFALRLGRKFKSAPIIIFLAAACSLILYFASGMVASNMAYRMQMLDGGFNESFGSGRGGIWMRTIDEIAASPLIGSGLTEKVTAFSPHNFILEAFMTTGLFGGVLFTALMVTGVCAAFKRARECTEYSWIAGLFLLYFCEGMVSGSILSGQYWFTLIGVLMIPTVGMRPKVARIPIMGWKRSRHGGAAPDSTI